MRLLIDTNVLIRWTDRHDKLHPVAEAALRFSRESGYAVCLVPQVLREFWVVATRPRADNGLEMPPATARDHIGQFREIFHWCPDKPDLFDQWQEIVVTNGVTGRAAHDANIVAAMQTQGITSILTLNGKDFQRYSEITIIDPHSVASTR